MCSRAMILALTLFLAACVGQEVSLAPPADGPAPTAELPSSPLYTPLAPHVVLPTATPNATQSQSWRSKTEITGISYHYPSGSGEMSTPHVGAPNVTDVYYVFAGRDRGIRVTTSIESGNGIVEDDAFPYNFPVNQGPPIGVHFPMQIQVDGATKAWLYVLGPTESLPADAPMYLHIPQLYAVLYEANCKLQASFETAFAPALLEQAQTTSLDQLAQEHYPVFDHMVRSVRFPEECAGK